MDLELKYEKYPKFELDRDVQLTAATTTFNTNRYFRAFTDKDLS